MSNDKRIEQLAATVLTLEAMVANLQSQMVTLCGSVVEVAAAVQHSQSRSPHG